MFCTAVGGLATGVAPLLLPQTLILITGTEVSHGVSHLYYMSWCELPKGGSPQTNPQPSTLNRQSYTHNFQPSILNPQPATFNRQSSALHPSAVAECGRKHWDIVNPLPGHQRVGNI